MTWEDEFSALGDYYPGSAKRIEKRAPEVSPEPVADGWDSSPRVYMMDGVDYEFFTIGDLAAALNRKPVTIRLWEQRGYLPMTDLRSPSVHPGKRHRIYTRPMVEGIVRIADAEGVLHEARPRIRETQFREKIIDLFRELRTRPLYGAVALGEAA